MTSPHPSSLAQQWAKKYLNNLSQPSAQTLENSDHATSTRKSIRAKAADRLLDSLRQISLRAWTQTEALLSDEIQRHQIDRRLINPWEISQDAFQIYEKALELYTQHSSYSRVPFLMGPDIAKIRKKYTQTDPRVIAFVSMQFHYTGFLLRGQLSPIEKSLFENCFTVIDDHLYMPLHRAYEAAANYSPNSPRLLMVQRLLEYSGEIALNVTQQVTQMYPGYKTYSGSLSDPSIQVSSQRDVEMFQIYLLVCVLENSLAILQEELFPLCIMLYPKLNVNWELVRQMLLFFGQDVQARIGNDCFSIFMPYLQALREMFSPEVFGDVQS